MSVRTVRVVNPAVPDEYMVINAADLAAHHELWPGQEDTVAPIPTFSARAEEGVVAARLVGKLLAQKEAMTAAEWDALPGSDRLVKMREAEAEIDAAIAADQRLRLSKGPRGLWYVMRGGQRASEGFKTEEEARSELTKMGGEQ